MNRLSTLGTSVVLLTVLASVDVGEGTIVRAYRSKVILL